ncbi:hypothetical protein [Shinella kummerowiae]|uniref:hypothetical protein n=1 Tax=Shinella kummerowiae TaxID=417745 RepID=UPI0021B60731|nr:hypothetical protein [Shinella kummerowiae]MCT7662346.1 hypothetical protein [Shinella kummerowiae]
MYFPPVCIASGLIFRGLGMLNVALADLEMAIRTSGYTEAEILRVAGIEPRYLSHVRRGRRSLTPRLVARAKLAIDRLKRAGRRDAAERETDGVTPHKSSIAAQYRLALATVQAVTGLKVSAVLDQDPGKRATADPEWRAAATARRLALYIANQYLNIPQADLGRAARMTKSAVCLAIQELEDMRDHDDVRRALDLVEGAFQG